MVDKDRIIVTGGAGFIGSNLVKKLIDLGYKNILVIDNEIRKNSIFVLDGLNLKSKLLVADIRDRRTIFDIFSSFDPTIVFHLAAEAIVQNSFANPYPTFDTNIMGTVNILDASRACRSLKGVIVASTDKAYGKSKKTYYEDAPLKGDHPYDVSKSAADLITQTYFKSYSLPVVITRFGNVYGEGDFHFGRIIPDICKSIIMGDTLLIRSDGKYVRDYLYVGDVVEGYLLLFKNLNRVVGEAYNFSSPDNLSVLGLIKKAEKIMDTKIDYKILNNAKNEIPYQHLSDLKIRKLGWKNKHRLEDSLSSIVEWYRTILQ